QQRRAADRVGLGFVAARAKHEPRNEKAAFQRTTLAHANGVVVGHALADEHRAEMWWCETRQRALVAGAVGQSDGANPAIAPRLRGDPADGVESVLAFIRERPPFAFRAIPAANVLEHD